MAGKTNKTNRNKILLPVLFTAIVVLVLSYVPGVLERLGLESSSGTKNSNTVNITSGEIESETPFEVHFIDIGQGDSQLIRIPGATDYTNILIDTGEYKEAEKLMAYLDGCGIKKIDRLICTHPHNDHMGAMSEIVKNYEIVEIFMPKVPDSMTPTTRSYEALLDAVAEKGLMINDLCEGTYIDVPIDALAEVYSPEKGYEDFNDLNDYSGVIRIKYKNISFLFTGDAEKTAEEIILSKGYDIKADILSCGHHGSSTSTSEAFFEAVNPSVAVISCAAENQYGHPHKETLDLLSNKNVDTYRTDIDGTVVMLSDGENLEIRTEK